MTDRLAELREQLAYMARLCDHENDYIEPNETYPYDHCSATWCMRCEVEKARRLVRLASADSTGGDE